VTRPISLQFAGAVYHLTRGKCRQKISFNDAKPTEEDKAKKLLMLDCKV
jgi:hypothetical protein